MRHLSATLIATYIFVATPAHAQEREWTLDAASEDAFLVFGVPQTEDVGVSLWCKIGSGKITLMTPESGSKLRDGVAAPMAVSVQGKTYGLQGRTSIGSDAGSGSVETELKPNDPLFEALEKADRFSLEAAGHKTTFPLLDADVAGLLKLCRTT